MSLRDRFANPRKRLGQIEWADSPQPLDDHLLVALAALVFISSLGSDEFKLRDVLLLTIGLAVLVLIVFIYALEMTVPVLPAFLRT